MKRRPKVSSTQFVHRADSVGWGLFFIWVGFAVLANVGWGMSLIGVSGIIFAVQGALYLHGEESDGFMIAWASVLLVGGVWAAYGVAWPVVPVLLMLLGGLMLANAFRRVGGGEPRISRPSLKR